MIEVRQLNAEEGREYIGPLADVLVDCVEGGASVSFMAPFPKHEAERFFQTVIDEVAQEKRILLAAFLDSRLVGTVQVITSTPPNQPHRGDVAKLLVLRAVRGKGIGMELMKQAEEAAHHAGKSLLVLDTVSGQAAERLYERAGWTKVGTIPRYAMLPDGKFCPTTIFWKAI